MADLKLPKTYESRSGNFKELNGRAKLSYSQVTSYNDPEYHLEYYLQYFTGIRTEGNDFSDFGGAVGSFIEGYAEGKEEQGILSESDVEVLKTKIDYPENSVYEDEVAMDLGDFVLEGYIDRAHYDLNNVVHITDFKTLNITTKSDYYASEDYKQTTLYCYFKESQGFNIGQSQVIGLGRKGTSLNGTGNYKMRLSGEVTVIPTPYSKERAERAVEYVKETAKNIEEDYKVYLKYFS